MRYSLALTLNQSTEVVERVLRVVRHRGFKVIQMNMQLEGDTISYLQMQLESERAETLLTNQLAKLIDVQECAVQPVSNAA